MPSILATIDHPSAIKTLTYSELAQLAAELRQEIIAATAKNGGHIAPSLGAVEIVLALHFVFNCPDDKFVFDVGHQAYAHKLVTGRRERFDTIRTYGGLSGYLRLSESGFDCWGAGHGSTSISAALGYAAARDRKGTKERVIAVIGDGSMTGGMAFEALNNAGHLKTDVIVVLNDNEMSIAPNVGALPEYLARLRTDPHYLDAKRHFERLVDVLPLAGALRAAVERMKDSVKALLVPGMLFEELGLTYIGPVDGHDLPALIEALREADRHGGPVLIHAITKKGKGYAQAEADSWTFHGASPFIVETGEIIKSSSAKPGYNKLFGQHLCRLAERDSRVIAITAAMPDGTGLVEFSKRFPDQFFDVGMAEQHAVTFAAGLALGGCRPVAAIYSTFLQRAYDQVIHDICLQNLPVVFAMDRSGLVGADGATHHGVFDLTYLRAIPNMVVMSPKDEEEFGHMLYTGLQHNGPTAVRYPRGSGLGVELSGTYHELPTGKAEIVREGSDAYVLAIGPAVQDVLAAAVLLEQQGFSIGVVNARFVKPIDEELVLRLANDVGNLITVEENVKMGGFGAGVAEVLATHHVTNVALTIHGVPDEFIEHGSQSELRRDLRLDAAGIAQVVRENLPAEARARVSA